MAWPIPLGVDRPIATRSPPNLTPDPHHRSHGATGPREGQLRRPVTRPGAGGVRVSVTAPNRRDGRPPDPSVSAHRDGSVNEPQSHGGDHATSAAVTAPPLPPDPVVRTGWTPTPHPAGPAVERGPRGGVGAGLGLPGRDVVATVRTAPRPRAPRHISPIVGCHLRPAVPAWPGLPGGPAWWACLTCLPRLPPPSHPPPRSARRIVLHILTSASSGGDGGSGSVVGDRTSTHLHSARGHALRPTALIGGSIGGTNLGINGLVSADRNNKATLPLTTPRCTIKSSAKDLSLRTVKLQYTSETSGFFHPLIRCRSDAIQGPKAYSYTTTMSQG